MEFFKRQTHIDFLGLRRWTAVLSIVLCVGSLILVMVQGLNWGLDFTGGYAVQVSYPTAPDVNHIRHVFTQAGYRDARVTTYGNTRNLMVRFAPPKSDEQQLSANQQAKTKEQLRRLLGKQATVKEMSYIGSEVGDEMANQGMLAIIVSMIAIMLYVAYRFEYRFAISAVIALAHDPLIILGLFSGFQIEFSLTSLAALLAVIGFSLNDTVVIYDRIRENFRRLRKGSPVEIINRSINDTLSRTIMTSGLTLMVVVVLYFFGGPSLKPFALVLIIGIIVGTYSSIYVAGALALKLGINRISLLPPKKEEDNDRP